MATKKKWYEVIGKNQFKGSVIGETLAVDGQHLIGRIININYGNLIDDIKKQNIKLNFIINSVEDNKAVADVVGYELLPSYIKRVTKRLRDKLEDSFLCITKDNVNIRIKPLLLLKHKTGGSIVTTLRNKGREFLINRIKKSDYNEVIDFLLNYRLQRDAKEFLNKIHPVGLVEIRIFKKLK